MCRLAATPPPRAAERPELAGLDRLALEKSPQVVRQHAADA